MTPLFAHNPLNLDPETLDGCGLDKRSAETTLEQFRALVGYPLPAALTEQQWEDWDEQETQRWRSTRP